MKTLISAFAKREGLQMLCVWQVGPLSAQAQATGFGAPAKFPQMLRRRLCSPQGRALALPVVSHGPWLARWPSAEALQSLGPLLSPLQSIEPSQQTGDDCQELSHVKI